MIHQKRIVRILKMLLDSLCEVRAVDVQEASQFPSSTELGFGQKLVQFWDSKALFRVIKPGERVYTLNFSSHLLLPSRPSKRAVVDDNCVWGGGGWSIPLKTLSLKFLNHKLWPYAWSLLGEGGGHLHAGVSESWEMKSRLILPCRKKPQAIVFT